MKKILLSSLACASLMFAANNDYKYEITPLLGGAVQEGSMQMDKNYANAGLALGFNQSEGSFIDQIELGILRSITKIDGKGKYKGKDNGITRFFTNAVNDFGLTDNLSLYTLIGLGVELFDTERGSHQENGLFGNYGVGLKYKISDSLALKFDLRHLIEIDRGDNTLLYNFGLAIPFGERAKAAPVVDEPVAVPASVVEPLDRDGDGVPDELDQCPDSPKGAKVNSVGCMTLLDLNINFDTDKADIKDIYDTRIHDFAKAMNANKTLKADIEGHTDSVGSEKYNQKLSERRAAAAVEALTELGVERDRIRAVGYGENRPVATNDTAEGRAQNRRVEAVMVK